MGTETKLESSMGRRETSSKRGKSCSWFQWRENARPYVIVVDYSNTYFLTDVWLGTNTKYTQQKKQTNHWVLECQACLSYEQFTSVQSLRKSSSDLVYSRVRLPNSPRSHAVCTWCSRGRRMDDRPGTVPEKREPRSKSTWSLFLTL